MKKIYLLLLSLSTIITFAQETETEKKDYGKVLEDLNLIVLGTLMIQILECLELHNQKTL
jgi:hypothetical protein